MSCCVCVPLRLEHQLSTRRRNYKFTRYLHSHRILERRISIETIEEENRPAIAKLTRAIPVAPTSLRRVEVQVPYRLELLGTRRNGILDHHVTTLFPRHAQLHDDQIARLNLTYERLRGPSQAVAHRFNLEPQVLACDVQVSGTLRGHILIVRVVIDGSREVERAFAAFYDSDVVSLSNRTTLSIHDKHLCAISITHALGHNNLTVDVNLQVVRRAQLTTHLDVFDESVDRERCVFG